MALVAPKTDWYGYTDENGIYTGDRFNAEDFNRIKNNLEYVREYSLQLYKSYNIFPLGADRTPADYYYADEMNSLEDNLNTINDKTVNMPYGDSPVFMENGTAPTYADLNRLESAIFDICKRLNNQFIGRRKLTWNFGMGGQL